MRVHYFGVCVCVSEEGGGDMKNQYIGGIYLKRGAWKVCRFKGAWRKKEGSFFEGGRYPNAHYGMY